VKLVSPESLDRDRRAILDRYLPYLPSGAVCINVVLGDADWDVRPLFLIDDEVLIGRFSDVFDSTLLTQVASEIGAFSLLFEKETKVSIISDLKRLLVTRPFFENTLKDQIEQGIIRNLSELEDVVDQLIKVIGQLSHRSVVHGHVSPANIVLRAGRIVLVDPCLNALQGGSDMFSAPEVQRGVIPPATAEIYSLGKIIRSLKGDGLSERQKTLLDQLELTDPRHRASLLDVSLAFSAGEADGREAHSASDSISKEPPTSNDQGKEKFVDFIVGKGSGLSSTVVTLIALAFVLLYGLYSFAPITYHRVLAWIPFLATDYSPEYESSWASRERARMAVVARAAVIRGEPAAVRTILDDIDSGENPPNVRTRFLRIACDSDWRNDLTPTDLQVALALGLEKLLPQGAVKLPALEVLHPGVLLAILAETKPTQISKELSSIPLSILNSLPEPFRSVFGALGAIGVAVLGDAKAIAVASIITGNQDIGAVLSAFPKNLSAPKARVLIQALSPLIKTSPELAENVLKALSDRDDSLSASVNWFAASGLADWGRVKASDKLRLLSGLFFDNGTFTQLSDLLMFPMKDTRTTAAKKLGEQLELLKRGEDKLLEVLIATHHNLSREQVISLFAVLRVSEEARLPYVTAWFDMKPPSEFVLLALLARNNVTGHDLFNLEAARYIRKTTWDSSIEVLTLLSEHPEPLARMLAYTTLNPSDKVQRGVLERRLTVEEQEACKNFLSSKLGVVSGEKLS
jgi:hypothetical protein